MDSSIKSLITAIDTLADQESTEPLAIRINEFNRVIHLDMLVSYSDSYNFPFFTLILKTTLPWLEHKNKYLRERIGEIMLEWMNMASIIAPVELLQTMKVLSETRAGLMYVAIPSIMNALLAISGAEKEKYHEILRKIIAASPPMQLEKFVSDQTWHTVEAFFNEYKIQFNGRKFIDSNCCERMVAVFAKRTPIETSEVVFKEAKPKFVKNFVMALPVDTKVDILTIAARISDMGHESSLMNRNDLEDMFTIIPLIVNGITSVEKAAMRPIWKMIQEMLRDDPTGPKLRALYAGVSIGAIKREEIIQYLKFDSANADLLSASIMIAMNLADVDVCRSTLFDIMPSLVVKRDAKICNCILEKLVSVFPILYEDDPGKTMSLVSAVLTPAPCEELSQILALRFLNSVSTEILKSKRKLFNVDGLIRKCLASTYAVSFELKNLIEKMEIAINSLELDWFSDGFDVSFAIAQNPRPELLVELLSFGIVPYYKIPEVIEKLTSCKYSDFYSTVFESGLVLGDKLGGCVFKQAKELGIDPSISNSLWSDGNELVPLLMKPLNNSVLVRLIQALMNYLYELYDNVEHTKEQNLLTLVLAKFTYRFATHDSISLVRKIMKNQNGDAELNIVSGLLGDYIPDVYTPYFSRLAIDVFGAQQALKIAYGICMTAVKYDRETAAVLAEFIDQPIPPMPTFLSFANVEKHRTWVEECRSSIPKSSWILIEGDEEYTSTATEPIAEPTESEEKKFVFSKPEPRKGIENVFDGTLYSLISYFTHYNPLTTKPAEVPGVSIEDLEQFVLDNTENDIRLAMGFFFYAFRRKYVPTRIEAWTQKLSNGSTEEHLYTAALFLNSITMSLHNLPAYMMNFVLYYMNQIGYTYISKHILSLAFQRETGVAWYFIRSVISLDPVYMTGYPIVLVEFVDKQRIPGLYSQFFSCLGPNANEYLLSAFISLVSVFFKPNRVIQLRWWPIAHRDLYSHPVTPTIPPPVKIDAKLMDVILTTLERQVGFPPHYFAFISHIQIEPQFGTRIANLLRPKNEETAYFFRFLLPSMYFKQSFFPGDEPHLDGHAISFIANRAPSFALAFYRSLMLPFTPPLAQTLISEVENLLCPVFPEFAVIGLNAWDNISDFTKIVSGLIDCDPLAELTAARRDTITVYNSIMTNPSFQNRFQATRIMIDLALAETAPISMIVSMAESLAKHGADSEDIVKSPGFMDNAPSALNALVLISRLAKRLNKPEIITIAKENATNKEIFECLGSREALDKVLHQQ